MAFLLLTFCSAGYGAEVLYDDTHAQTAGNADWVPEGAYSEMADMLKANGFKITSTSKVLGRGGEINADLLKNYQAMILAEPNNPYSAQEKKAITEFVYNGGGLFIIGDHGGADRNNNGWDAVKVFNDFISVFGFKFQGNSIYESPLSGAIDTKHPAMFGVRAVGAWAGSTFDLIEAEGKAVGLINSRIAKAPYVVAAEYGQGRVLAIGDSSPFDDGVGSPNGSKNKLHDSYDSFMYSHPQLAYNAMAWTTKKATNKRIPSRPVPMYNEAKASEKAINILVDAAHGNASSDKMKTFEKHMKRSGLKVYFTLNLIKPEMLKNFGIVILPDPSLRYIDSEAKAIADWFMAGGNLVMGAAWDSSRLRGTATLNYVLNKIGAVTRFNDDQVWDEKNKTNKPWGVLSKGIKKGHPATSGVSTVITWGTCSLITRDNKPLSEDAGVEILVTANDVSFNKDGDKRVPAVLYPKGTLIPIMAIEKVVHGTLVMIGTCNFTDYQYPDSDINQSMPGSPSFTHETPKLWDNLLRLLAKNPATRSNRKR